LSSEYFWWVFWALFVLFSLPAALAIFLQLDGLRLVTHEKLEGLVLFIHSQNVTYLAKYGSLFLLPYSAYATLTNETTAENRRKGFKLFNIFFVLLLVSLVFLGLTWMFDVNIVGYPDKTLPMDLLVEILRGGADACREAGCVVVGGHSVRDSEIKFGLAVTGRIHPQRILRNCSARPGDVLILTKPLGTGVLVSARKAGKIEDTDLAPAIAAMSALNKPGRDAVVAVGLGPVAADLGPAADHKGGVHAGTDITGYGLIGHAFEMAEGSDVTIDFMAADVPLLPRTLEMARAGVTTRAAKTARGYLGAKLAISAGIEEALADILANAETSGGLLLSVTEPRAAALISELQRGGALCAALVGRVEKAAADGTRIRVA